jgi:hypothetical protein
MKNWLDSFGPHCLEAVSAAPVAHWRPFDHYSNSSVLEHWRALMVARRPATCHYLEYP